MILTVVSQRNRSKTWSAGTSTTNKLHTDLSGTEPGFPLSLAGDQLQQQLLDIRKVSFLEFCRLFHGMVTTVSSTLLVQ